MILPLHRTKKYMTDSTNKDHMNETKPLFLTAENVKGVRCTLIIKLLNVMVVMSSCG